MRYQFLVDTYESEILKVVSAWSMFDDGDLLRRPHPTDARGRNLLEHMTHQCMSEDTWFINMLGIRVTEKPLPDQDTRLAFMERYSRDASLRLAALSEKSEEWWEGETGFFETRRTRLWVMTRRLTHTAHHRGQQIELLRILNHVLHSNYGPTADTGGLPKFKAPTIYAYPNVGTLLEEESGARRKAPLPGPGEHSVTERPDEKT